MRADALAGPDWIERYQDRQPWPSRWRLLAAALPAAPVEQFSPVQKRAIGIGSWAGTLREAWAARI